VPEEPEEEGETLNTSSAQADAPWVFFSPNQNRN
jgi:hypothetical protein